jgi:hypothetical protein
VPFAGLDLVAAYTWHCDLDQKPGRYGCPITHRVNVVSESSTQRRTEIRWLGRSSDGLPAREVLVSRHAVP